MTKPRTLFDKIWDTHLVNVQDDGTCLIYIDRHLVHEVTSPQAFEGLRNAGHRVRRPDATLAVADHNVPTTDRSQGIDDKESHIQVEELSKNCAEFGIELFDMKRDPKQYTNLAQDPTHQKIVARFKAQLAKKLKTLRENDLGHER